MTEMPKVYVSSPAKATGKLKVLRELYAEAVARGEHVHWYGPNQKICRNGTPECPYHDKENP